MNQLINEIHAISSQLSECLNKNAISKINDSYDHESIRALVKLINRLIETTQESLSEVNYSHRHIEQIVENRTFELQIEKEKFERANTAKDLFIANMSHELRTPLNAVMGVVQLIKQGGNLDKNQSRYVDLIMESSKHLLHMMNDLLDLSKIENDDFLLESKSISIYDELAIVIEWFAEMAKGKDIKFEFNSTIEREKRYIADPHRLKQVFSNLIANAIKFTPEKGQVTVDLSLNQLRDDTILFSVSDTGVGIPEENIEKIFKPFMQGDNSITRQYGGAGLGLAICRKLVEQMKGEIDISSIEGHGTTVTVNFPLAADLNVNFSDNHEITSDEPQENIVGNILLVEDNPTNQIIAKEFLEILGHSVDIADDGGIAVKKVQENDYDLILMDLHMPVKNGFDAISEIRMDLDFKKPIIALTADLLKKNKQKAFEVGASDFMGKPFEFDELKEVLVTYMR